MGAFKDFMNRGQAPTMAKPRAANRGGNTPQAAAGGGNRAARHQNTGGGNRAKNKNKETGSNPPDPTVGPALPDLNTSLGLHAPNTGGFNNAFAMGSAGFGIGNKPTFSDTSDFERTAFNTNPQGGFNAFLSAAGMAPTGQDAFGQWLGRQFDREQQNFNALKMDDRNQNLNWLDYLANLGGVIYGQPGWEDGFKRYWTGRYNNDSALNRGLNDMPYQGNTRWLAFG